MKRSIQSLGSPACNGKFKFSDEVDVLLITVIGNHFR